MHEQLLNQSLLTPHQKIPESRQSTTTRKQSSHKRTPIFSNSDRKSRNISTSTSTYMSMKLNQGLELEHIFSDRKVIVYDFCGCENKMMTCQVIVGAFLGQVSRNQLRASYSEEYDKVIKNVDLKDSRYHISLLSYLPTWYPELLYSQLKNLVLVIGMENINPVSFECLAAIEYHCKAEYIAYFLYKDLKKSYENKQHFCSLVQKELSFLNTSFKKLKYVFEETSYMAAELEKFINNYYDSIGANLVPMQYYAKFLAAIYVKGSKVFVKMLTNFLVLRQTQLKRGLKFLLIHELEAYRNYMREFNFQDFIEQAQ